MVDDRCFELDLLLNTASKLLEFPKELEFPLTPEALNEPIRALRRRRQRLSYERYMQRRRNLPRSNLEPAAPEPQAAVAAVFPQTTEALNEIARALPEQPQRPRAERSRQRRRNLPRSNIVAPAAVEIPEKVTALVGEEAVEVLRKIISKTDVTPNNSRLSMPGKEAREVLQRFLGAEELRKAKEKEGLRVTVVSERGGEYVIALKLWKMGTTEVYNLAARGWNTLVTANALRGGNFVGVYAFRRGDQPCFAVVTLENPYVVQGNN